MIPPEPVTPARKPSPTLSSYYDVLDDDETTNRQHNDNNNQDHHFQNEVTNDIDDTPQTRVPSQVSITASEPNHGSLFTSITTMVPPPKATPFITTSNKDLLPKYAARDNQSFDEFEYRLQPFLQHPTIDNVQARHSTFDRATIKKPSLSPFIMYHRRCSGPFH